MELYALLIGIDDYPVKPLSQCVNDVKKIEEYLQSIRSDFSEIHYKTLKNSEATKNEIIKTIESFLSSAKDNDVCLFYYSGHGAQEETNGIFSDEHDGLLECIVAYHAKDQDSGFLLGNKEIRYLLSRFQYDPHLITVFDCCHSGDMVRAMEDDLPNARVKRIAKKFSARNYDEFIFSDQISAEELKNNSFSSIVPYKNHIHLAASLSHEFSWEDENGGVFTRYLLKLLEANNNKLNYLDIVKWAKISLKNITKIKQTPTISVQGHGKLNAYSSWLNLHPAGTHTDQAMVIYNKINGWYYTRGRLMGVEDGMVINIVKNKTENFDTVIEYSDLEFSKIKDPKEMGYDLDITKKYKANTFTTYSTLKLYVNDLENEEGLKQLIQSIISKHPDILLAESCAADFFINIFNQMVYISLPGDEFRPLTKQIDLLDEKIDIKTILEYQLSYIIKWNHFNSLYNPDNNFDKCPLKIEIATNNNEELSDITNSEYYLDPLSMREIKENRLYQTFRIKITNVSNYSLNIGVLTLGSDFSISSRPFCEKVIKLDPGQTKFFYDHNSDDRAFIALDNYMEVYNWKSGWCHYKFIISNYENFESGIRDFLQPGLEHPVLPILSKKGKSAEVAKAEGSIEDLEEVSEKWGTLKTTIYLKNTSFNMISGDLEEYWAEYMENEQLAPFISKLYFTTTQLGLILESSGKPNRMNEDQTTKGFWDIKMNIGNYLDDKRRYRIFKKARKVMTDKPVVIAEGDSWFLYPFLVKDTIDYVMEKFPVRSIAAAGDTLENYQKSSQLLKEVAEVRPEYVLISGGGNDIIGPEIVHILKKNVGEGKTPEEYLNNNYKVRREKLMKLYEYFFKELKKHSSVKRVFVHGYDFVRADHDEEKIKNGWVNKYMIEYGIKKPDNRERLIRFLVNNFNSDLDKLTRQHNNVVYLDMRGLIDKNEWYDEIHPNDTGFKKVGNKFIEALQ